MIPVERFWKILSQVSYVLVKHCQIIHVFYILYLQNALDTYQFSNFHLLFSADETIQALIVILALL